MISVVLATRDRSQLLQRLLECLVRQSDAPPYEVIVADNGSRDSTENVLKAFARRLPLVTVNVPEPGKGRALNAAIAMASGELMVFTDDDVMPSETWLCELYEAAAEHKESKVFGGRIDLGGHSVPGWIRNSYNLMPLLTSEHAYGDDIKPYGFGKYPIGPNMAIRRRLIEGRPDPYPVTMGPGTKYPVGDEIHFLASLSPPSSTDRLYVGSAVVVHDVERENVLVADALKRCFHAGRAHGWLGTDAVTQEEHGTRSSMRVIASRVGSCASLREFLCMGSRYAGFLVGGWESAARGRR